MAVDKTLKLQIRAFYESHELSVAKVHEYLDIKDVSVKTIEYWVSKENWQKNKYSSKSQALEGLFDAKMEQEILKEHKENLKKEITNVDEDDIDEMAGHITKFNFYEVLSTNGLKQMMSDNLQRGEYFASRAKNIGTVSTFHNMLTTTIQTIYGKQYNHKMIDPSEKIIDTDEMEQMSIEELKAIAGGA